MTSRTAYSTQTPQKSKNFDGHYLRDRSTLDIGVLGYIGIVWPKEHSSEVRSFPPGTPCIYIYIQNIYIYILTEWPRRNVPNFGRVFLMLNYTDIYIYVCVCVCVYVCVYTGWSKSFCVPDNLMVIIRCTETFWSPCIYVCIKVPTCYRNSSDIIFYNFTHMCFLL
jgi:hypothetical protein